jgi:flagellar basal body rod protein FlgG
MNVGFYSSVNALLQVQQRHEVTAANLARQGVAGHRAAIAATATEAADVTARFSGDVRPAAQRFLMRTGVDFSQGALERDGNPLHLAIQGQSLFHVRTPDGANGYTRNGAFERLPDGTLSTAEGYALLDESGQPVNVPSSGTLTVAPDGVLVLDGEPGPRIGLAAWDDPAAALRETFPGFFTPAPGAPPAGAPPAGDRIAQGALERSNAAPVQQMVGLIAAFRAYESNQRAITAQDEATGRLLRATSPNLA